MEKTEVKTVFLNDFDVMRVCFTTGDRHGTNNRDQEKPKMGNVTIQILIAVGGAGGAVKGASSAFRRWELRVAPGGNDDS